MYISLGYQFCKIGLSTMGSILLCTHLIGDCQVFVFILHLWTLMSNAICVKYDYTPHVCLLAAENIVTLASFVCIAGNTEDATGLSNYETAAVTTGILWGVHLSHITYVAMEFPRPDPYASFVPLADDDF